MVQNENRGFIQGGNVRLLVEMVAGWVGDTITKIDQQLSQAALSCGVVAEHGGEGGVSEWFGEALAEGLAGAVVVTEPSFWFSMRCCRAR